MASSKSVGMVLRPEPNQPNQQEVCVHPRNDTLNSRWFVIMQGDLWCTSLYEMTLEGSLEVWRSLREDNLVGLELVVAELYGHV